MIAIRMDDITNRLPCRSDSDEVGDDYQRNPDRDEKNGVGNKVWKAHESQSTNERDNRPLPFAIHEEAKPNRPEEQTPKKPRLVQRAAQHRSSAGRHPRLTSGTSLYITVRC